MPPPKEPSHNRKWFIFSLNIYSVLSFIRVHSSPNIATSMPDFRSDFDDPSDMVQFGVIGGLYCISHVQRRVLTVINHLNDDWEQVN